MNDELIKNFNQKLKALVEKFRPEAAAVRTNRPSSQLVENLKVNYFDQFFILKQLASVSVVPPREIQVSVWDKNSIPAIIKALEDSDLGANANVDGQLIRLNLPTLSAERRQELIKLLKKMAEEVRIKIRSMRDDAMKDIKKLSLDSKISEDQEFKLKEGVQRAVEAHNKELEEISERKIKEIAE